MSDYDPDPNANYPVLVSQQRPQGDSMSNSSDCAIKKVKAASK